MRIFSSLRSRIFLTSALLAVLSIGIALYVVNQRVTAAGEATLRHDIVVTATLVDQLRKARMDTFMTMAHFISDTSQLKAAVDTRHAPTVQAAADDIYAGYRKQLNSKFLIVTNNTGSVLAIIGASDRVGEIIAGQPAVREALAGHESVGLLPQPDGVMQLVSVPIALGRTNPEILGTVSVGFLLDDAFAAQLKATTGSEIAFGIGGQILATTLRHADRAEPLILFALPDVGERFAGRDRLPDRAVPAARQQDDRDLDLARLERERSPDEVRVVVGMGEHRGQPRPHVDGW